MSHSFSHPDVGVRREITFHLYLVTDRHKCAEGALVDRVESALSGGVGAVQLREKDMSGRALSELAAVLLRLCRRHGVPLLINDRIDVALAVGADGIHLPADSFPVAEARRLLGPRRLIAVSTHSEEEVADAYGAGADFAVFGPVFSTPSKSRYGPPLGLDRLRTATARAPIPVFAIGGVTPERAPYIRDAGAFGVAAISSLLSARHPAEVAQSIAAAWIS